MDSEINTSRPLLNVPLYILGPCFIIAIAASFQKNTLGTRFRLAVVIGIAAMSVRAVKFTVGGGPQNYSVGCAFGPLFFNAVALLLLSDPVRECKYVSQTEDTAKMPFWKRVYWVLCIQCNLRGIRWNFEVSDDDTMSSSIRLVTHLSRLSLLDRAVNPQTPSYPLTIPVHSNPPLNVVRCHRRYSGSIRRHEPDLFALWY